MTPLKEKNEKSAQLLRLIPDFCLLLPKIKESSKTAWDA
jgi:hypothetical protein